MPIATIGKAAAVGGIIANPVIPIKGAPRLGLWNVSMSTCNIDGHLPLLRPIPAGYTEFLDPKW